MAEAAHPEETQPGQTGYTHRSMSELARSGQLPASREGVALELAMRIGDMFMVAGMSANDATVYILKICNAYGLERVHVDVTFTSITASYYPGQGLPPISSVRVVRPSTIDLSRISDLERLVVRIQQGLDLDKAVRSFDLVRAKPHPYPGWIAALGSGGIGWSISLLFSTDWRVILLAFLSGLLLGRLLKGLDQLGVPPFFRQFSGTFVMVFITATVSALGRWGVPFFGGLDPTMIAVGGIFQMVAGAVIVAAAQDAIDSFHVTATARILEVVMLTSGIVVGLIAGLSFTGALGMWVYIAPEPLRLGPLWAQFLGAGLVAALSVMGNYADRKTFLLAGLTGCIGWAGFTIGSELSLNGIAANAVGALALSLVATLLVRRSAIPGFALVSSGMLALVPGLALYNGMTQLVGTHFTPADTDLGLQMLGRALAIALAISAGATLGTFLGRPLSDQLRRIPSALQRHKRPSLVRRVAKLIRARPVPPIDQPAPDDLSS